MKKKNEHGVIIVEASIYIPIVFCVVMMLLYMAFFNLQEYSLNYQAQRIAAISAREFTYKGYNKLGMGANNDIDFSWGKGGSPSGDKIVEYYEAHNQGVTGIYKVHGQKTSNVGKYKNDVKLSSMISENSNMDINVIYDTGFFGDNIIVTVSHSMKMPGIFKFLGYNKSRNTLEATAYTYASNPANFVRNYDFADDLASYILPKFNIDYDKIKGDMSKIINEKL